MSIISLNPVPLIAALAVASLCMPRVASASLILNGSFESPALAPSGFVTGAGSDWTSNSVSFAGPGVWEDSYLSFTRIPAHDGNQVLWMPPGTSISQSVVLSAGTSYSLSFFTTPQTGNTIGTELLVTITGGGQSLANSYSVVQGVPSWTNGQFGFTTSDAGIYSISFQAKDTWTLYGNSATLYLDSVGLAAVPDSGGTFSMLAFGIIAIASFRLHQKRRQKA